MPPHRCGTTRSYVGVKQRSMSKNLANVVHHAGRYRNFCDSAPADFPLFLQYWYLDAVCTGGIWEAVFVEKNGKTVAVLPYFIKKTIVGRYITMPVLGRLMGPYILPEFRDKTTPILKDLIQQLPDTLAFAQDFNYTNTNWLPFYWQKYRQSTRYSYVLNVKNLDSVWKGILADYRNNKIPKAQRAVRVEAGGHLQDLYNINNLGYARQNLAQPFSFTFLQVLDQHLAERKQREIFTAVDQDTGAIHAAAYLVWDRSSAYYLIAGDDPALRASGAGILMVWTCIQYTSEVLGLPCFDFLGSMVPAIEQVRRNFGAVQQPYFRIEKESSVLWKMVKMAKSGRFTGLLRTAAINRKNR